MGSAVSISASAFAAASASPVSSSSSRSSSCSIWRLMRSDERPNCMRRSLAICNLSFSISSALYCTESSATFSSLWQARAKARSETISSGSSAVASDIPTLYPAIFWSTIVEYESVLCQTSTGRIGAGGVTMRRQSIASISTASCAGVSVIAPSTIGGHTNRPLSSRLASSHSPLPSQYIALK